MKKIRLLVWAFLLAAATASPLFAFSFDSLDFIGFSRDGNYLAFEDSGDGGDGGGAYSTTYYIDTAGNRFAAAPSVFVWDSETSEKSKAVFAARYKKSVTANLRKFGIIRGYTGELVVLHLLTDWSFVKPIESEHYFYQSDGTRKALLAPAYKGAFTGSETGGTEKIIFNPDFDYFSRKTHEFYELTLTSTPLSAAEAGAPYKLELTLVDKTKFPVNKLQILQKDVDKLPKAREDALGYKIERVYLYGDRIAVFINVFAYGYEEAAMSYMVVTGKLAGS